MVIDFWIKNNIERVVRGGTTDFLNFNERSIVIKELKKRGITPLEYIPFEGADKTIIYNATKPSISVLKIKCSAQLKHNEILGALFSHQISPTKYGDIIIDNDSYLIVLDSIKEYLLLYCNFIGKHQIILEEVPIDTVSTYQFKYKIINILVSSMRADNVISSLINTNRKEVNRMFNNKYILLNNDLLNKITYVMKPNDIISIRRYGKYRFKEILRKTSKGKWVLTFWKYE